VSFIYSNERNGGKPIENRHRFDGAFTEQGDYGIMVGAIAPIVDHEKTERYANTPKKVGQIIRRLVRKGFVRDL
jgi:hypothetical protein